MKIIHNDKSFLPNQKITVKVYPAVLDYGDDEEILMEIKIPESIPLSLIVKSQTGGCELLSIVDT